MSHSLGAARATAVLVLAALAVRAAAVVQAAEQLAAEQLAAQAPPEPLTPPAELQGGDAEPEPSPAVRGEIAKTLVPACWPRRSYPVNYADPSGLDVTVYTTPFHVYLGINNPNDPNSNPAQPSTAWTFDRNVPELNSNQAVINQPVSDFNLEHGSAVHTYTTPPEVDQAIMVEVLRQQADPGSYHVAKTKYADSRNCIDFVREILQGFGIDPNFPSTPANQHTLLPSQVEDYYQTQPMTTSPIQNGTLQYPLNWDQVPLSVPSGQA